MSVVNQLKMDTKDFEIYFPGEITQMDVNTLITSLVGNSTLIQQINQMVDPQRNIEIKIKPFAPGSFKILVDLWADPNIRGLFSEGVGLLNNVMSIFVNYLDLRKHLKDSPPKTIGEEVDDKIVVENVEGNKMTFIGSAVNLYLTNPVANDATSKAFEVLKNDESIDEMQIKEGGRVLFQAPREEFAKIAVKQSVVVGDKRTVTRENATLNIVKLSFQEGLSWLLYYDGNRITATITDKKFYESVEEGERFGKGDTLLANLTINQKFDKSANTYVNDTYEITDVLQHIPRQETQQQKLINE